MDNVEKRKIDFIEKANKIHNGKYDYSKVEYINNRTNVCIIDKIYGEFYQTPSNHLKGRGHPLERAKKISEKKLFSQEEIIKRFKEVHQGENMDYTKVVYKGMHEKVCIICRDLDFNGEEYGEFWQEPVVHLKGCTHPRKAIDKNADNQRKDLNVFINEAKKIHPIYDFSKVAYTNYKGEIIVVCPKHGEFKTTPDAILHGKGCPRCGHHFSKAENEINDYISKYCQTIHNDRKILDGKEIDILIPSRDIGIEYNGLRWHSEKFGKDRWYHLNKTLECEKKGIKLIQIFEDEYIKHKGIVLSKLSHILNIGEPLPKIMARKCTINEISVQEAKEFLNINHIQGFVPSTVYLGGYNEGRLIGVMTFLKEKDDKWNLTRFASDINYVICGLGGKLFKYFIKKYEPKEVKSFLDRRWMYNEDNIYIKLGFRKDKELKPDYRYVVNENERVHKFNFRKDILHRKYGFPLTMNEREMTKALNVYKAYDCGLIRYIWKKD